MNYDQAPAGVFAPPYYSGFKCTADKCRHSCCIDWEICIDDETLEKYRNTDGIMDTVEESEDGACFALKQDGRCPHLNESGLCDIIITHGPDLLCEICDKHPRFFSDLGGGRVEAGLGIVCEEACRLVLENEEPFTLQRIKHSSDRDGEPLKTEILTERDKIMATVAGEDMSFDEILSSLRAEYGLREVHTPDEWTEIFLSLEILDKSWKDELTAMKGKCPHGDAGDFCEYEKYYRRLLSYFVYRHVSTAEDEVSLRGRLAFAILSVEMIRRLFELGSTHSFDSMLHTARRFSAEIEYSEDNTDELIFELEFSLETEEQ